MKLTQQHYPTIEIDNREPDIIQIWQNGKEDSNVIQIEREKLVEFCAALFVLNKRPTISEIEGRTTMMQLGKDIAKRCPPNRFRIIAIDEPFVELPPNIKLPQD